MQRKVLLYDKSGEEHFNLISALHKSVPTLPTIPWLFHKVSVWPFVAESVEASRRTTRLPATSAGSEVGGDPPCGACRR